MSRYDSGTEIYNDTMAIKSTHDIMEDISENKDNQPFIL